MNKLTCSTLAIFLTSSVALASDGEWNSLEHEVNALSSTLNAAHDGPTVFGRVRTYYTSQAEGYTNPDTLAVSDMGGWSLANMRLGAKGQVGPYDYKLQAEFKSGTAALLDAYASFGIGETMVGTFGQFKAGVARASRISSGRLLFRHRNMVGDAFSGRTGGLMLGTEMSQMGLEISAMNGLDSVADEILLAYRISATIMGSGPGKVEGAYGGTEDPTLSGSMAFVDDGISGDATVFELNSGTDLWSFDVAMCTAGDFGSGSSLGESIDANSSPMSIQGSYMLQPGKWELAVRFQDFDKNLGGGGTENTTRTDVAINNYINGHALKWMVNVQSDTEGANDNSEVTLGLQASF